MAIITLHGAIKTHSNQIKKNNNDHVITLSENVYYSPIDHKIETIHFAVAYKILTNRLYLFPHPSIGHSSFPSLNTKIHIVLRSWL